jgi:hypothetical protein
MVLAFMVIRFPQSGYSDNEAGATNCGRLAAGGERAETCAGQPAHSSSLLPYTVDRAGCLPANHFFRLDRWQKHHSFETAFARLMANFKETTWP